MLAGTHPTLSIHPVDASTLQDWDIVLVNLAIGHRSGGPRECLPGIAEAGLWGVLPYGKQGDAETDPQSEPIVNQRDTELEPSWTLFYWTDVLSADHTG